MLSEHVALEVNSGPSSRQFVSSVCSSSATAWTRTSRSWACPATWPCGSDALANLADLLDGSGAPLGGDGTVVLQEAAPGSAAARVVELVALGADTFTAVRQRAGLAPASTSEALALLESLALLDRLTPVGEDPRRTRRVRYQVRDPFLRLWRGVILPHREAFELGRAGVLSSARPAIAASQRQSFAAVVRDWLGEVHETACGPGG